MMKKRIGFALSWIFVNMLCWPMGLFPGVAIGLAWIQLLAKLIPGRGLGYGFLPGHQYIQIFIWSAIFIGGSITGLVVGVAHYGVLRKYFGIPSRWILVNIWGWSLGGFSAKLIDSLHINPLNNRWGAALLFAVPFGIGAMVTGLWLNKALVNYQNRPLSFFTYGFAVMLGAFVFLVLGPFPLTQPTGWSGPLFGVVQLGLLIGGFSLIPIMASADFSSLPLLLAMPDSENH